MLERTFIEELRSNPLDGDFQLEYAIALAERKHVVLAYAELRTAELPGVERPDLPGLRDLLKAGLPKSGGIDHNTEGLAEPAKATGISSRSGQERKRICP